VIIALPILIQPKFIKEALSAGKHVLAEKPLAKDVETGKELIDWYHANVDTRKLNFSIAEQFRYLAAYAHGAKKIKEFGKILGVRVRMHTCIQPGAKYYETEWRKKPEYQGGFLLDGGVHFVAGIRNLLSGSGERVKSLTAFTSQLQEYLPPVDTVDSAWKLSNGSTGTFSVSFGTSFSGAEWSVACEGGTVSIDRTIVKSKPTGSEEVTEDIKDEIDEDTTGAHVPISSVATEVFAWAKSLKTGKWDSRQSAEEGLADLEIVEAMLRSGENDGKKVELRYQI
jgi:predicted dehydrogenase